MTKKQFLKRFTIFVLGVIIFVVVVIFAFISPISKYLIEKYDVKYSGREITMEGILVNPFSGYIRFDNLRIYELESDSLFISIKELRGNVAMSKLPSNLIELSSVEAKNPFIYIIQNKKTFNFDDLIVRFTPNPKDTVPSTFKFNLLETKIVDGRVFYFDTVLPVRYNIKNIFIENSGIQWNSNSTSTDFSFLSGTRTGEAKGKFDLDFKTMDYQLAVVVKKFDLKILEPYLKEFSSYGNFKASLDANVKSSGNFYNPKQVDNIIGLKRNTPNAKHPAKLSS